MDRHVFMTKQRISLVTSSKNIHHLWSFSAHVNYNIGVKRKDISKFQMPLIVTFLKHKKVKVKCTLVQALRLCTGRTVHRGSRGIALLFHDHGTRRG